MDSDEKAVREVIKTWHEQRTGSGLAFQHFLPVLGNTRVILQLQRITCL